MIKNVESKSYDEWLRELVFYNLMSSSNPPQLVASGHNYVIGNGPEESTYRHQATIDDEVVSMEILDTAGQEDVIQKEGHVRWGEGFVLVYDITDRGSFEEVLPLKNLLDEVKKPKNVTLILVGNKADLDHSRQVSTEEGEKLATELACAFYECSACTGEGNIMEAFYELCREVRRRKMVQGKTRRRSSTTHVKQAINKMLTKISS
ncbi:ras-related and estrogen-regulated growth inhibitor-like [Protobothrops mucrosquamatus]|uniref:ras-related and estrogen-regulated growth inhibitor-like n=1 Tax=Protobothrops mucrosquamatus TaxID=103944 RepID=UPI00077561C1|nr:ras-related and estrogen-regulated growth inhibitor-like [Protobothrops mucrosquamatus]